MALHSMVFLLLRNSMIMIWILSLKESTFQCCCIYLFTVLLITVSSYTENIILKGRTAFCSFSKKGSGGG